MSAATWTVQVAIEPTINPSSISTDTGTFAGNGEQKLQDGGGGGASFNQPADIDAADNNIVFVADAGNHAIRILEGNNVRTLAGTGQPGMQDGEGPPSCTETQTCAQFYRPGAVAAGVLDVGECGCVGYECVQWR